MPCTFPQLRPVLSTEKPEPVVSMGKISMAGLSDILKPTILLTTSLPIFKPLLAQPEVRLPK